MKIDRKKLHMWQDRLALNENAYLPELERMDRREELYAGDDRIDPVTRGERKTRTPHVRNICTELIEAEIDSNIPQPKVTARRKKDEAKAKLIEDMLRNELDRLPFEEINDIQERTVPIQGGSFFLVEWDNDACTHQSVGELTVAPVHPRRVIPQAGVFTGVEDMDYIILKIPQTKEFIRRRYGVDVKDEREAEPEIRLDEDAAEDLVTQYVAYYRNDTGGVGLYSWVGDTQLEDMEDYQARRVRCCRTCGAVEDDWVLPLGVPTLDGEFPGEGGATRFGGDPLDVCVTCTSHPLRLGNAETPPLEQQGEALGGDAACAAGPQHGRRRKTCPCGGEGASTGSVVPSSAR